MNVNGQHFRTIWPARDEAAVEVIDQRWLPHKFVVETIRTVTEMVTAIREMHVRGAGLIGAAAAYGVFLAAVESPEDDFLSSIYESCQQLKGSRPTAVNLEWALRQQLDRVRNAESKTEAIQILKNGADAITDGDAKFCESIGEHGLPLIQELSRTKNTGEPVNILTHCNAGWLAFVDFGTATAPIYAAQEAGIDIHVWVDETRPRNQGARLTAWELGQQGVAHTVISDNTGGHLMQHGRVDMVIVGSDRTTRTGYVANKIGTYLKALAAADNEIPFYAALPSSSIDWNIRDGLEEIPIEERGAEEVKYAQGLAGGDITSVLIAPEESTALNYGFDVTPPRLITGLITERGVATANEPSLLKLFPEYDTPDDGRCAE